MKVQLALHTLKSIFFVALLLGAITPTARADNKYISEYYVTSDYYINQPVMVQLKTNALWVATGTLNIEAEVQVDPKWTFNLPIVYSPYNMGSRRKWRILAFQPEARWWPKRAGVGHFVGINFTAVGFNIAFRGTERYQDPNRMAWGLGVNYGYALPLDKKQKWWADFSLGLGFVNYEYDKFRNSGDGRLIGHGSGTYWGVTRASIGIAYRWQWHHHAKRQKGGVP